jgi:hypothetical protein
MRTSVVSAAGRHYKEVNGCVIWLHEPVVKTQREITSGME